MRFKGTVARLLVLFALAGSLVAVSAAPAQAAEVKPASNTQACPTGTQASTMAECGLVTADARDMGGRVASFYGLTWNWTRGPIYIWGIATQDGTTVWSNAYDPIICYQATQCSFTDFVDCTCYWGWIRLRVFAKRGATGATIVDDDWVYVQG